MADDLSTLSSVTDRARTLGVGEPVVAAHFLGDTAVFVLGEQVVLLVAPEGEPRRVAVHDGGILTSACNGKMAITGGDDGKLVIIDDTGETKPLFIDPKRRWIDHVAVAPDGALVWSVGKTAVARTAKGQERSIEVVSTVGGLTFLPKGFRVAIAHYNGASLWFPNVRGVPQFLEWKGSHLGITVSPDGKFLVTAMQEPMLHGWRLDDNKHMRMTGYAARVRSLSWSAGGPWLATAGADQLILWPFQSKDGPMGKTPRLLAPYQARVVTVACHPKQDVVAVGYADGLVLLVRIEDGAEILAKRPGAASITALAWNRAGTVLALGTEAGEVALIVL